MYLTYVHALSQIHATEKRKPNQTLQLYAALIQTIMMLAILGLPILSPSDKPWFTITMSILNSIFAFCYGLGTTGILMSAEQFIRKTPPVRIDTDRVLQLLGASTSLGSGIGGVCVYFVVQAMFN
eukprot:m.58305 g.58305  ORF g.58305 m.58305 type:complete len:125 (-) comp13136_c0_seq4:182-556(-)